MIRPLLPCLDLPQGDLRVLGGVRQHGAETIVRHEVRARARGQIAAARQDAHGFEIDLLIAADGVHHGRAALGEGRRVKDDIIICPALLLGQLREQIEHIGAEILHAILQAVERCIVPRGRERIFRYIHRQDGCRACRCAVEPESPGVREAVEHMLALCELRRCAAVILLIEEKPGFLSMDIIHVVQDAVFPDRHVSVQIRPKTVERHKACPLLHAFFLPELDIIALVDRVDLRTACVQRLQQERE